MMYINRDIDLDLYEITCGLALKSSEIRFCVMNVIIKSFEIFLCFYSYVIKNK